jgi:hypothetical protein
VTPPRWPPPGGRRSGIVLSDWMPAARLATASPPTWADAVLRVAAVARRVAGCTRGWNLGRCRRPVPIGTRQGGFFPRVGENPGGVSRRAVRGGRQGGGVSGAGWLAVAGDSACKGEGRAGGGGPRIGGGVFACSAADGLVSRGGQEARRAGAGPDGSVHGSLAVGSGAGGSTCQAIALVPHTKTKPEVSALGAAAGGVGLVVGVGGGQVVRRCPQSMAGAKGEAFGGELTAGPAFVLGGRKPLFEWKRWAGNRYGVEGSAHTAEPGCRGNPGDWTVPTAQPRAWLCSRRRAPVGRG